MLRGQNTLSRLVGKRRRRDTTSVLSRVNELPNASLLEGGGDVESPTIQRELELVGESSSQDPYPFLVRNSLGKENLSPSWVKCPVCEKDIQADDQLVNVHLDLCLLEKSSCEVMQKPVMRKRLSLKRDKQCFSNPLLAEGKSNPLSNNATSEPFSTAGFSVNSVEDFDGTGVDRTESNSRNTQPCSVCSCPCHLKGGVDKLNADAEEVVCEDGDHLGQDDEAAAIVEATCTSAECGDSHADVLLLETVIVGRKFNRHVKIERNMVVKLLREPDNPKDGNAIKVVGPNSQGNIAIGHLPRNLASCLSSLLDKDLLTVEGMILTVPEKVFDPVPIKLLGTKTPNGSLEDPSHFRETWQRAIEAGKGDSGKQVCSEYRSRYVHNFTYLLKAVLEREAHLFNEKELSFLGSFFSLKESAQCLFVRLSQRKGPWFRVSQLNYDEVADVVEACNELVVSGFFSSGDVLEEVEGCFEKSLRERLHVLSMPELKQILLMINLKSKRGDSGAPKKEDLLDCLVLGVKEKLQNSILDCESKEAAIVPLILKTIGFCVRLSDTASFLVWRLQRLFFLNGEQDASTFLLVEMGAFKFPSYVCFQTRKVFMTQEALLAYEQALEVAQAMDIAVESNDLDTIEHCLSRSLMQLRSSNEVGASGDNDVFLVRFTAAWVFVTIMTVGVSVLERERRYGEAIKLLRQLLSQSCCPGKRGHWTIRLSVDLEHLGYKEESLEVAEVGLNDLRIRHGHRIALQKRVLRLGRPPRRWKKPSFAKALTRSCKEVIIIGRTLNCQTGVKSRFYGYDDSQCSVEELALQYYGGDSGGGWQGVHSEGGVWMTLFGLLMWDVIFANVPNVFWHPFQTAPLDLTTDAFYYGRETMIEKQLWKIEHGESPQLLTTTWSKWFGTFCRGVNWERHSLEELQVMALCVGGRGLASICRLLAEDYGGLAGGMPDLFLWRVHGASSMPRLCSNCSECCMGARGSFVGDAKLVEVKGPRDRLSDQQQAWINVLMEAGMDVEVCYVREQSKSEVRSG